MRTKQEVTSRKKAFHYILNPALAFISQHLRRLPRETQSPTTATYQLLVPAITASPNRLLATVIRKPRLQSPLLRPSCNCHLQLMPSNREQIAVINIPLFSNTSREWKHWVTKKIFIILIFYFFIYAGKNLILVDAVTIWRGCRT